MQNLLPTNGAEQLLALIFTALLVAGQRYVATRPHSKRRRKPRAARASGAPSG